MKSPQQLIITFVIWLKCKVGWHKWGEIDKEFVNITGPHILFFSWGHQDGKRTCAHCGKIQHLYRSGFVGGGCEEPKWYRK